MAAICNDILMDVSMALVEPVVNTTLIGGSPWLPLSLDGFSTGGSGTTGYSFKPYLPLSLLDFGYPILPGTQTVTPGSMAGIYAGCQLVVGSGTTQETITVISVTATSFTAIFAFPHSSNDSLIGATFPTAQNLGNPLFLQSEMLQYAADVQNEFLLKVRPIVNITTQTLSVGLNFYNQPSDSIRMERISVNGIELWNTSQPDIDMNFTTGPSPAPSMWFQDDSPGVSQFGVAPAPQVGNQAEIWYTQRGSTTLQLGTPLLIPSVMSHAIKYGVLARAFSKDGEQRNDNLANICQKHFDLIVQLSIRFIESIAQVAMPSGTNERTDSSFSPVSVGAK